MWQVTWRSVRHHPLRFVLSLIAVFLGSAYVAGTFTLNGMLTYTFQGIVATQLDADVYVMPAGISPREFVLGASTGQVDSNLADYVDPVPGVLQATPYFTVGGTAVLGADRGRPCHHRQGLAAVQLGADSRRRDRFGAQLQPAQFRHGASAGRWCQGHGQNLAAPVHR